MPLSPEERAAQKRAWRKANPDKVAEQKRRYRIKHAAKIAEAAKRRYRDDPQKEIQRQLAWRRRNPGKYSAIFQRANERGKGRMADWRRNNNDKLRARDRRYRERHPYKALLRDVRGWIAYGLGVSRSVVPPQLVEAKAAELLVRRAIAARKAQ